MPPNMQGLSILYPRTMIHRQLVGRRTLVLLRISLHWLHCAFKSIHS